MLICFSLGLRIDRICYEKGGRRCSGRCERDRLPGAADPRVRTPPLSAAIDAYICHVVEDSHSSSPQQERRDSRGRQAGTVRPGVRGGEVFHRRLGYECARHELGHV